MLFGITCCQSLALIRIGCFISNSTLTLKYRRQSETYSYYRHLRLTSGILSLKGYMPSFSPYPAMFSKAPIPKGDLVQNFSLEGLKAFNLGCMKICISCCNECLFSEINTRLIQLHIPFRSMKTYAPKDEQPKLNRSKEELSENEKLIYDAFMSQDFVNKLVEFLSIEENKGKDKYEPKKMTLFKVRVTCDC